MGPVGLKMKLFADTSSFNAGVKKKKYQNKQTYNC
jgi:hypothetical protein